MKLALIGGGGVRAPEFVRGALAFARDLDLHELWLMDNDARRLNVIAPLCEEIVKQAGAPFTIKTTNVLDDALRDAALVVTTIRVGNERGRVLDERVALKRGVLGQETTGAGGFSMAMRSIPALIHVMERIEALAPRAWTFNFTNPAGLVAQALTDAGFRRVVGICDSANTAQQEIARWLGLTTDEVKTEVFGLNHLSWARSALVHGENVLPKALADTGFVQATHLRFFGETFVQRVGMFLNEYLYYYYFREVALQRIQEEELTRGEQVEQMNAGLFTALAGKAPQEALRLYDDYNHQRNATYMSYAEADAELREKRSHGGDAVEVLHTQQGVGGYAGVALRTGLALTQDRPLRIALNVPNRGAIHGMRDGDIVEVTCEVDGRGIQPVRVGEVPESQLTLMQGVKHYERLAVESILKRDRALAIDALMAHPLVGSYPLAEALVTDYLIAHAPYVGEWK